MSVWLSLCLSVCLSVCLCVGLCVCPPGWLCVCVSPSHPHRQLKVYSIEDYSVIQSMSYPAPVLSVAMSVREGEGRTGWGRGRGGGE